MSSARLAREHRTVAAMVRMYCRGHHGRHHDLCADCTELLAYAAKRIDHCPHGTDKPSCGVCTIHCYERTMKERIAVIMRWSGPRMTLRHPWLATMHLFDRFRAGRRQSK